MNDSFAQHSAQTPSPSTGSRQETHSVGSAMSSASCGRCANASRQALNAPRRWLEMERDGDASASMGARLAPAAARGSSAGLPETGQASVPTGMASNPTAAPILFDRALLRARHGSRAAWRAGDVPARSRRGRHGGAAAGGDAEFFRRRRNLDAGRIAAKAAGRSLPVDHPHRSRSIGNAAVAAGIARSRRLRARLPVRQRSARRAGADPPRAASPTGCCWRR